MTEFNPSESYSGLLKQAYALFSLVRSKQQQIAALQSQLQDLSRQLALADHAALEAERHKNAMLTESLLNAEDRIAQMERDGVAPGEKADK